MQKNLLALASFLGFPTVQFLIACGMQNRAAINTRPVLNQADQLMIKLNGLQTGQRFENRL